MTPPKNVSHPGLTSQEIVEIVVLGARYLHRNSATFDWFQVPKIPRSLGYPLVNIQKAIENGHL